MQNILTAFFIFASGLVFAQADIESPDDFLVTDYGKEFTPYHLVVNYFEQIARRSPRVEYRPYGFSTEKRQLGIAIISSEKNMSQLEQIRLNNLKKTGLLAGKTDKKLDKAIVWVNFGVHGNEAAATESAMEVLFELATTKAPWLEDVVVILNPCANPDGFDRYVNWNRSVAHQVLMPNSQSREHREPWPTGRSNHYYFDLNRDWAWATQKETKALLETYQSWMPHVVPDMHEQYPNNSFYFAPAAHPFHEYLSVFQSEFQKKIGLANAHAFDERGWLYFTKETFDLFYPGYGDTYPLFNGAIGMTYEQAGHGVAGRAIQLDIGDTLTIRERIDHFVVASISTIRTAAQSRQELVKAFQTYFENSQKKSLSGYQAFVIKRGDNPYRLRQFVELLDRHRIKYFSVKKSKNLKAYSYQFREETMFDIGKDDLVIPAKQPMGVLASVLLEPNSYLEDSLTYDVTAWSLPYAYGLEAYAVKEGIPGLTAFAKIVPTFGINGQGHYAWVAPWQGVNSAAFLVRLLQEGVRVRRATKPFSFHGKTYRRGSLMIAEADNRFKINKLEAILRQAAKDHLVSIDAMKTGYSDNGPDLGSWSMKLIKTPKVAMVYGKGVNAYQYGEMWHFMDVDLELPFVALSMEQLEGGRIWDFNTIVLADGDYHFQKYGTKNLIKGWVKKGGKLILMGQACLAIDDDDFNLIRSTEHASAVISTKSLLMSERLRANISSSVPGGLVEVLLDNTHPLAYGYGKRSYFMKNDDLSFSLMTNGENVGYTSDNPKVVGFFGQRFLSHFGENMLFGQRRLGDGHLIYLVADPIFRGFWEEGKLLVANALFLGQ